MYRPDVGMCNVLRNFHELENESLSSDGKEFHQ